MSDSAHANTLELIPAYALGALDAAEETLVTAHLAQCPLCRQELLAYEAVADALPLAAPDVTLPPGLKDRLMGQVHAAPVAPKAPAPGWLERLRVAWSSMATSMRWQPAALALIALLAISNVLLWQRLNQVADRPETVVLMGTEEAPDAWGLLAPGTTPDQVILVVDGLPPLDPAQQYQLWLIRDGERDSGGVFSVSQSGYMNMLVQAPQAIRRYTAFGVTVEPTGGSPGPTGPRVLGTSEG